MTGRTPPAPRFNEGWIPAFAGVTEGLHKGLASRGIDGAVMAKVGQGKTNGTGCYSIAKGRFETCPYRTVDLSALE